MREERLENIAKELETEGKLFGIYYSDFKYIFAYLVLFILVPQLLGLFSLIFFIIIMVLFIVLILVLRHYSKSKYYKYLNSVIAKRLFEPKKIYVNERPTTHFFKKIDFKELQNQK